MNFLSRLLVGWTDIFPGKGDINPGHYDPNYDYYWLNDIFKPLSIVLYIIMGLVGAAGAIYAIYLGVQLARADEQGKRDEARKHLITVLIAVAVTIAFVLFFNLLLPLIVDAFLNESWVKPDENGPGAKPIESVKQAASLIKMMLKI